MQLFVRSTSALSAAAALAVCLAGCAADGSLNTDIMTSSVNGQQPQQQAKVDAACAPLVTHIEDLRRDGISEKIEKAANKKYKMTNADLVKADQLNKANSEFQQRCTPQPAQASIQPVRPVTPGQ